MMPDTHASPPEQHIRTEFSALQTLARINATVLDMGDMLAEALNILADAFHYRSLAIILIDDQTAKPRLAAISAEPPHPTIEALLPFAEKTLADATLQKTDSPHVWSIPLAIGQLPVGALVISDDTLANATDHTAEFLTTYASQITVGITAANLYQKTREQQQQALTRRQIAEHLQQLATIINATLDLDDVLKLILERIQNVVPYQYAAVMLLRGQTLTLRATDGFIAEPLAINTTENIFYQQALLQQYPTVFHNITENTFWKIARPEFAVATKAWIGAPLVFRKRIIGLLTMHHTEAGYFDDADLDLVHTFANQAAIAIENARLYRQEQQKVKQFHTVAKIGRQAAEIRDIQQLLETIIHRLHDDLGYEFITVFLFDPEHDTLTLCAANDIPAEKIPAITHTLPLNSDGVISTAARTQSPLLVNDISAFPGYFPGPGREAVKSEAALPLVTHNGLVGVLDLQSNLPHYFEPDDITLVQTVADQLAIAIETANLQRQQTEFIQNVSHELRNPLTFLRGYLDLILEDGLGPVPPKIRESLTVVSRRTETMQKLVDDLVTYQRLKIIPPEFSAVDIHALITATVTAAQPTARQKKIALKANLPPTLPAVSGNTDQLRQVLDNLLSNALKFTPEGGHVTLTARPAENTVQFSVTDTGLGIPPSSIEKVFQRFYRAKVSAHNSIPGTGLGLTIVKQIIDSHHGTISVKSTVGQGTTFTVSLPVFTPETGSARQ